MNLMLSIDTLIVLIPALPLAATLVIAVFGKTLLGERTRTAATEKR